MFNTFQYQILPICIVIIFQGGFIYNADVYYNARMNVLEKIKKMQAERGWSTYKLSYESGLTQSTLSNMFTRGTCPTVDTLEKICEAFGISLSEFFEEDERKIYASKEERDLLNKYRALSDKEKDAVRSTVNALFKK